ncbi:nuclear factor 7, ovary-like [Astyanax mexicanus]|uniref:Nuclear factor 7, ovary-like n=2 Tax=Astyanax mexicanus TaxID=7994 RepID=A0A8T2LXA7_ASTMX|nr:nuclear factor 7, ovary-like [Astyanax mexicanus]
MEAIEQTLKCPVCMDFFTDPVLLPCGHNFCRTCICTVWGVDVGGEGSDGPLFCPECQIFLPSDLQLETNTDIQEKVQMVQNACGAVQEEKTPESQLMVTCDHCIERRSVAVKSCLSCDASLCSAHTLHHQEKEALRGHTLIDVTEELQDYKCEEHSEELKLFCQDDQAAVCSLCVVLGTHNGHRVVQLREACSKFKKVLQEREAQLLERRHEAEKVVQDLDPLFSEVMRTAEAYRVRIAAKYSHVKALIEKDEQLMMNIIETEEFYTNKWLQFKRESYESHIRDINTLLTASKSLLQEHNDLKFLQVAIHLDADTAHPNLDVSSDMLEVCWSKQVTQEDKETEQTQTEYSVLAKEAFSSGCQYWEVAVWEKPYWLIGLSYGPDTKAEQKDTLASGNVLNKAFCYIYHGNGKYLVCNGSEETVLPMGLKIQKLGVWVDLQRGTLSFYDADTLKLLHSFTVDLFGPVYPMFNPCIGLNEQNTQPLVLFNLRSRK